MTTDSKNIVTNAMTQGSHKQDWVTPWKTYNKICDVMSLDLKIDVCATPENSKCAKYITPEMDFFKTEVTEDAWMNPMYSRGNKEKGIMGIENFVARLYHQHIMHNINTAMLITTTSSSAPYWHIFVGERLFNAFGEKAEPYFVRERIKFEDGPKGQPYFSSIVIVHRRKSKYEMIEIQRRFMRAVDDGFVNIDDEEIKMVLW